MDWVYIATIHLPSSNETVVKTLLTRNSPFHPPEAVETANWSGSSFRFDFNNPTCQRTMPKLTGVTARNRGIVIGGVARVICLSRSPRRDNHRRHAFSAGRRTTKPCANPFNFYRPYIFSIAMRFKVKGLFPSATGREISGGRAMAFARQIIISAAGIFTI